MQDYGYYIMEHIDGNDFSVQISLSESEELISRLLLQYFKLQFDNRISKSNSLYPFCQKVISRFSTNITSNCNKYYSMHLANLIRVAQKLEDIPVFFVNYIHGDFHLGNIVLSKNDMKLIDPRGGFYSDGSLFDIAYDFAKLLLDFILTFNDLLKGIVRNNRELTRLGYKILNSQEIHAFQTCDQYFYRRIQLLFELLISSTALSHRSNELLFTYFSKVLSQIELSAVVEDKLSFLQWASYISEVSQREKEFLYGNA